jgi:hypothetical protein
MEIQTDLPFYLMVTLFVIAFLPHLWLLLILLIMDGNNFMYLMMAFILATILSDICLFVMIDINNLLNRLFIMIIN